MGWVAWFQLFIVFFCSFSFVVCFSLYVFSFLPNHVAWLWYLWCSDSTSYDNKQQQHYVHTRTYTHANHIQAHRRAHVRTLSSPATSAAAEMNLTFVYTQRRFPQTHKKSRANHVLPVGNATCICCELIVCRQAVSSNKLILQWFQHEFWNKPYSIKSPEP